jgi:hypothetical protein
MPGFPALEQIAAEGAIAQFIPPGEDTPRRAPLTWRPPILDQQRVSATGYKSP